MSKRFHLPRILGLLTAITCTCVTLAIAAQVTPEKHNDAPDASGIIVLDAADSPDSPGQGHMPPVAFDHNLHTQKDKNGATCATCHESSGAATAQVFRPVAGKTGAELEEAYHTGCVSCHVATKSKGMKAGPLQAECRTCHNAAALPPAGTSPAKADGGMDASLHARHVASPLIAAPGSTDNCAACHHPVKNPVSPGLKADSCRTCHPASAQERSSDRPNQPLFADVAHKKCISCHQALGPQEAKALTCNSCHDAKTKAGYAKLSPPPRLEAGQPDAVMMGLPKTPGDSSMPPVPPAMQGAVPDKKLDAATSLQPSMPPVVFDHKRHETTAENCTSCHHNTLQKCSTCHTPQGNPKGKNVTEATAMHMPTSSRSCVGCHETRKTATPECASCHGGMPAKAQPNCESCHQPLDGKKISPADPRMRGHLPPGMPEHQMHGAIPGMIPGGMTEYAAQKIMAERAKTPAPDYSNVPEKLVLGLLADKFEPSVFPHRAIVEKLAAGIKDAAPGMMWFHASPNTLCASCHHNSPPSATPPSCVSCHAKGAAAHVPAPADNRPLLKVAYHQQCMSCHTRMDIKPAATDCAGCHALRQKPQKTGGGK